METNAVNNDNDQRAILEATKAIDNQFNQNIDADAEVINLPRKKQRQMFLNMQGKLTVFDLMTKDGINLYIQDRINKNELAAEDAAEE